MIICGSCHTHSRYSHDGQFTLSELKAWFVKREVQFVIMTEHAEDLTPESYRAFYNECIALSDESFLFIPGLEVPYEGKVHVGCFPSLPEYEEIPLYSDGIARMRADGALAIYHHPSKQQYYINEQFKKHLDGIEIWNSRYEGAVAPSVRTLAFAKKQMPDTHFLGGLDFHKESQGRGPLLVVDIRTFTQESVMKAIHAHAYTLLGPWYAYPGDTKQNIINVLWYRVLRVLYSMLLTLRRLVR